MAQLKTKDTSKQKIKNKTQNKTRNKTDNKTEIFKLQDRVDLPMQAILEFQKIVMHLTEKVNESSNLIYYMHHVCCKKCQRS